MRTYALNSPQSAARIVALALVSDGHLSRVEWQTLERLDASAQLGLSLHELQEVVHALCEDLLSAARLNWSDVCRIDPATLASVLEEIRDPDLRTKVLSLCTAVVQADAHLAEGEVRLLTAATEQWGLTPALRHA
jgi:uncharacterized tellurite resistance protein B-like protein